MAKVAAPADPGDDKPKKREIIPAGIDRRSPSALKEWRPTMYRQLLDMLVDADYEVSVIAQKLSLPRSLVQRVALKERKLITSTRDEMKHLHEAITHRAGFRVLEDLPNASARDAAIIGAVSIDKLMAWSGEPSKIVEHRINAEPQALTDVLEVATEVVDVTPTTKTDEQQPLLETG